MSGGGSRSSGPTKQNVIQSNVPEYLQPYMQDAAARAQAVSREKYIPYGRQRLAGFTPEQSMAFSQMGEVQAPVQLQQAADIYSGMGRLEGPGGIQQYMNPYQEAVTERAIRSAREEAARQRGEAQLGAAARGSAGGSRQAIMDAMREAKLTRSIGDIQAEGRAQAFDQAREAQRISAAGLAGIAPEMQRAELTRLGALQKAGAAQQALRQQMLDQQYADFLRQRDFPKEQLRTYTSVLRGFDAPASSTQLTYERPPSMGQQLGSLGIAGLGAYMAGRTPAE